MNQVTSTKIGLPLSPPPFLLPFLVSPPSLSLKKDEKTNKNDDNMANSQD